MIFNGPAQYIHVQKCTCALDEEILTDMVINKWFIKDTERDCLRRKLAADADGAPLSFEVNLRKEQRQYDSSVGERIPQ